VETFHLALSFPWAHPDANARSSAGQQYTTLRSRGLGG